VEVVVSLSQGRTAAAQCGLFTYKSVPVIFEPPCSIQHTVSLTSTFSTNTETFNSNIYYIYIYNTF